MNKDNSLLQCTIIVLLILTFSYFVFKNYKHNHLKKISDKKEAIIVEKQKQEELKEMMKQLTQLNKATETTKSKSENRKAILDSCKLDKNMNSGKCHNTKVEHCPMGSYKQCTNNKKIVVNNCDCHDRNSILCQDNMKLSEKCLENNDMLKNKLVSNEVNGIKTDIRVNNHISTINPDNVYHTNDILPSLRHRETEIRKVPQILAL